MARLVAAATVVVVFLAGCADNPGLIHGSGTKQGDETRTVECQDGTGVIMTNIDGTGRVVVSILGPGGASLYENTFDGTGDEHETQTITGAPGAWTVHASFGGQTSAGSFVGEWDIDLTC